jgi:2-oxoglutarate dehydrogenase E1 component
VLPVLVHGDAAFAGQGVVMETLNLAQTRGYGTGGTVHIVINNQIGFTTSDPRDKAFDAVLHRRGQDDRGAGAARERRRPRCGGVRDPDCAGFPPEFAKDVVVDIICFRKLGHNEQDTPAVTQPLMYKRSDSTPAPASCMPTSWSRRACIRGESDEHGQDFRAAMDEGRTPSTRCSRTSRASSRRLDALPEPQVDRRGRHRGAEGRTEADGRAHHHGARRFQAASAGREGDERPSCDGRGDAPLDWGMGETWPSRRWCASGYAVRLSGQDSGRGTFTHRHAVLHDQNREKWNDKAPISRCKTCLDKPGAVHVIDSVLSEEAVLGFEYGYAIRRAERLVIWEAQFGDFVNGAQVVIDQFISSGEDEVGPGRA